MDGENNDPPADMAGMDAAMDEAMGAGDEMDPGMGMDGDMAMDGAMDMEGMDASPEASPQPPAANDMGGLGDEEEGEMEEAIDYSSDQRLQEMKTLLNELYNFKEEDHWKDEFYRWMLDFLDDPNQRVLFFWNDFKDEENCPLQVSNSGPPRFYGEGIKPENYNVACFIKKVENDAITVANLRQAVMFKLIFKEPLDDLLDKMNQEYIKTLLADNDWPDGVKKEFVANVHRFMAFLNEHTHMARGQTYLYIPQEDLNDPEANAKDRDLLQRLEQIVINWTRQIKELVSSQDSPNSKAIETPLDEINYWQKRTTNLEVLTDRLDHPDLQKITRVLWLHKSSYLSSFQKLRKKIEEGYLEAQDNLRFLGTLSEPCRKISLATPKNIPALLPDVLNSVRIIWELSTHYNTEERMKSLLVKISNQIIDRCKDKINVDDMLYGDVEKCMQDLQESMDCCRQWIEICGSQQKLIKKYSSRQNWKLDTETIFAENEAFIQRCRELMEICEGQLQFARKGQNQRMPIFGGVQGATYTNNLLELEKSFNKNLQKIAALKYDILDVKNTQWHDDYGQLFKEDCKSLEMTIHNIISLAFKNVSTVSDAVELLENFDTLAKRPLVRDFVHRKAADMVYKLFAQEIKEVEDTFESQTKKVPPMPFSHPKHAGQAIWAYSLIERLNKARSAVRNLHFIPESNLQKESLDKFQKLSETLDQFIEGLCFRNWTDEMAGLDQAAIESRLERDCILTWSQDSHNELPASVNHPLFTKSKKSGLLESGFDSELHKVIVEGTYWHKIFLIGMISLPNNVNKLLQRKETLRVLRENVMLIVRDYNNIKHTISDSETLLFAEHLGALDQQVLPGIRKFNWTSSAEFFVNNVRKDCKLVFEQVKKFQNNVQQITGEFDKISRTSLANVEKNLYDLPDFVRKQEDALKAKEGEFINAFDRVSKHIMDTYELFIRKRTNIQEEWLKFMQTLDSQLQNALKQSVKTTLLHFGKHIMGEKGSEADLVAIFNVYTILEIAGRDEKWNIIHEPTHDILKVELETFMRKIIKVTRVVPRVERIFRENREACIAEIKKIVDDAEKANGNTAKAFENAGIKGDNNYQNMNEEEKEQWWKDRFELPHPLPTKHEYETRITKNEKIQSKINEIIKGIDAVSTAIDEDKRHWNASEERRQLSSMSKDKWLRRMLQSQNNLAEADPVAQYRDILENLACVVTDIQNRPALKSEKFINLDCGRLKTSLLDHVKEIEQTIFSHLTTEAKRDLTDLLDEWNNIITQLKQPATQLELLKANKAMHEEVMEKLPLYDAKRDPIRHKFNFIKLNEDQITHNELTEDDKLKLEGLDDAFQRFKDGLEEAHGSIRRYYQQLKTEVDNQIEDFKKECQEMRANFKNNAPYHVNKEGQNKGEDNEKAFQTLRDYKEATNELRGAEDALKLGLDIFEMEAGNYPEVNIVEKEIDDLTQIWNIKKDWDGKWDALKDSQFRELKINDMTEECYEFKDHLKNLTKDVKEWKVFEFMNSELMKYQETMPLIEALQDVSMRPRHWKEIRMELKDDFDEDGEDFSLEKIYGLNLLTYQEKIFDVTENAKKQLKIESGLKTIDRVWTYEPQSELVIAKDRSRADNSEFYYVKDTGEIMQLIEDHGGHLGQFKSSPYYKEFQEDIDNWEQRIAQVTETLETLMTVQKLWQYLEQIFKGQQDIQKQLPNDDAVFKKYDAIFKSEMERCSQDKNAINCLLVPGFLPLLNKLQYSFEGIQKSLNSFLEQKRGQFPRFFFLSNTDLLEMIGQSKDPKKIITHIRKIFEGIYDLSVPNETKGRGKNVDIDEILSSDGEAIGFQKPIEVDAKVEMWMGKLEEAMKIAIRQQFNRYLNDGTQGQRKQHDRERMLRQIKEVPGQILIGLSQISWTTDLRTALSAMADNNKSIMKQTKKNYKKKIETYVDIVDKQPLDKKERNRLVALIIIDVHHYEIINMLIEKNIASVNAFEWQQQLRFEKTHDDVDQQAYLGVRQTKTFFKYGCEYQGNNGRLVVTALTDRCYMTLTSALYMYRGGAPQGPAGTGKTETVKDLGKNLAFYVVVQNCSDRDDIFSLGRLFAGLALSGSWGCFDEFNRISVDVLSVVAFQVQTLLDALRKQEQSTHFGDLTIQVLEGLGLFITMNPGYAGRSELPDNLASLFRPVAMMKPDFQGIIKISLMSEGFRESDELSKKIAVIYDLMLKQLSKSDHYDFGMRAIKSVLNATGRVKRENRDMKEVTVAIKALRDMNLPKFIADDVPLFDNLFIDLFPDCDEPENDNDELQIAIEESLQKKNLLLNENLIVKIMQLYESKVTRHSNMLVGKTQAGKSTTWQILQDACCQLQDDEAKKGIPEDKQRYKQVRTDIINPKSVNNDELFGFFDDQNPPQWQDGVLSSILKKICEEKFFQQWMILDGPVDTLWIESLNSVMDDSKLLTLTNGDRIFLTPGVKLLFEVENLAVASPATVSRAGMIFMDVEELGWEPCMTMWIHSKADKGEDFQELLKSLVEKYLHKVLKVKSTQCSELVPTTDTACIVNMCHLYDALSSKIIRGEEEGTEEYNNYIEKWFVFSLIWSVGCTVDEQSRKAIDDIIRDIDNIFPSSASVFEYFIKLEKRDFVNWEEELKSSMKIQEKEFHKITVPTVDTVRNRYIVQALIEQNRQILVVGQAGVGKTVLMNGILAGLDHTVSSFTINFSAGSSSNATQEIIEGAFDRKAKSKYKPKDAKAKVVAYVDDLNMPRRDTFGSQPPLELLRQWIDYKSWYDREKIVLNHIDDLQLITAMGPPGGGRQIISNRMMSCFHTITYTVPSEGNMMRIYGQIVDIKFSQGFLEEVKNLKDPLAQATINIFNIIQAKFLPTPASTHYVFNMRDISKVFTGVYMAHKDYFDSGEKIVKLWAHEVLRVFSDRLNTDKDREVFKGILNDQLQLFDYNYEEHCATEGADAVFVDFLNDLDEPIYNEVTDFDKLRSHLNDQLDKYNSTPKQTKMDLVLFKDALIHISKIYRILNLKRGHALLIGVGGSGRHSLTNLSSFLQKMKIFQLEITKGFKLKNFREKMKEVFEHAGFRGRDNLKTTLIFSDNDVVQESFLEDISNILNSGVIPNLFASDEMTKLRDDFRRAYKRENKGAGEQAHLMDAWFFNNIKDSLHLSICFSPLFKYFKDYLRNYPALINSCTIDWFMPWPVEALNEVAVKYVGQLDIESDQVQPIATVCAYAHATSNDASTRMLLQLKRNFYVTPTNYIELLKGYGKILEEKRKVITTQSKKLSDGLEKLSGASSMVATMQAESDIKRQEVQRNTREVDDLLVKISAERKVADEKQVFIQAESIKIEKEAGEAEALASEAEADLKHYEPELKAAEDAIAQLDNKSISEVKSYTTPPEPVMTVMSAVMIVLGKEPTWPTAKKMMTDSGFINQIKDYDKEATKDPVLKKIEKYTREEKFRPEYVTGVSKAAGILCMWVRAVEGYAKALKTVAPKRARMQFARDQVAKKMKVLKELEDEFQVLAKRLAELQELFDTKNAELEEFSRVLNDLQTKIDRGDKLIQGLAGEKLRWEATIDDLADQYEQTIGNCLLSAAFMSYCGPFPSDYRQELVNGWKNMVQAEKISHSPKYDFPTFMASEAQARAWQLNGLPTDSFSTENGCFVSKGLRWALNIDPQTQAMNWIKKMEGDNLEIADFKDPNHLKRIEMGITYGKKVLFLDVGEEIDPTLDNVLNKNLISAGGRSLAVKIGDKEVEYNPNFKLYITTRMSNPHYTPEVSTKVTVVNFQVKEDGLEEQCLGIVVLAEQPTVEQNRGEQIMKIEQNNAKIIELEDNILQLLQDADPDLILENVVLIDTLQDSKETQIEVKETLQQAQIAMRKINDMREQYRPCGKEAAILFFVLNDLNKINTMYQFSLDWYKKLFLRSINESGGEFGGGSNGSKERCEEITKKHMQNVYDTVCRSLFERHKILLSMQMCIKRQLSGETPPDMNEWNFFLKGGEVLDRATQPPKPPFDWITQQAWDNLTELSMLSENFKGIDQAVSLSVKDWHKWYQFPDPESRNLPGEWQTKCEDPLKAMIVLRCLRPDRVTPAIKNYVNVNMGTYFTISNPTILREVLEESSNTEPIIFVLSPGVDPTDSLKKIAADKGIEFETNSMGKGQSEKARKIVGEGAEKGKWIFLANCHLSIALLPELESIMDNLFKGQDDPKKSSQSQVSENFRLILSASPHEEFSISLLQRSLKITQEPPKGIKANMLRLYGAHSEFHTCDRHREFRKAIYGLTWFHTILIERKKFKSLGWNVQYAFADSDYQVCEDLLAVYMGKMADGKPVDESYQPKAPVPWPALITLIAQCNYGGRVTDDYDRRLMLVYANEIFNDNLIGIDMWKPPGTEELNYYYPADEANFNKGGADPTLHFIPSFFYDAIRTNMENNDLPSAYGQHVNAEINSQILDTNELLSSILTLTPQQVSTGGGEGGDGGILKKINDLYSRIPELIDKFHLKMRLRADSGNPLNVVLMQEVERYEIILKRLKADLAMLDLGLKGLVVITPDLEQIVTAITQNTLPTAWAFAYFSMKPLSNWFEDLCNRYDFFDVWGQKSAPFCFWLGAFTYPTGFTTSLLQRFSRKSSGAPIDQLQFEFIPIPRPAHEVIEHPKDGAYIRDLYLEGAKWDYDLNALTDANPMELTSAMPVMHFKPCTKQKKAPANMYACPAYYYPQRKGTVTKDSYQLTLDLKSGDQQPNFWVKRGTAILLSLAN